FPSPVGGVPFPSDLVVSVLFALLYGLLIPVLAGRVINKHYRSTLSINTAVLAIERLIVFCLRAAQSQKPDLRTSQTLTTYIQVSIGLGYVVMVQDIVALLRCVLVNSTVGSLLHPSSPNPSIQSVSSQSHLHMADHSVVQDQPRRRFWYRRLTDFIMLLILASLLVGVIGNSRYRRAMSNPNYTQQVTQLRYASSGIALAAIITTAFVVSWAAFALPKMQKSQVMILLVLCACTATSAIYRLAVLHNDTTSLTSTASGSGNTAAEKTEFYIFHMLTDWTAGALLLLPNIKTRFGTGMWGDWRSSDESIRKR
ncbi:hypothetical protein CONPUDRAFT_37688, partial [Coniophora puteana RWD-64-598 SS2]